MIWLAISTLGLPVFPNQKTNINTFNYSYSYDLTHTLQHNLTEPKQFVAREHNLNSDTNISPNDDDSSLLTGTMFPQGNKEIQYFGVRGYPHKKFVWNLHLLSEGKIITYSVVF